MEAKATVIASSLVEPSILELANNKPLTTVPPRYVRPDIDHPLIRNDESSAEQLPVIDMHKLVSGDDSELEKLDRACKDWGFFQLINHGVSSSLVEKVKAEILDFFDMPIDEKRKFWQQPGDIEGFGQLFIASEEQKLDWGYGFTLFTLPNYLRKLHLLPKLPLPFRDDLEVYLSELKNLALKILDQMAKALRMDPNDMKELFENGVQSLRMNYYPPCPQPEQVIGINSHCDASALTILLQINQMDGLQIKKDGKWVAVRPLPDAFIVNIGDILEVFTNGTYRSIEHRATMNSVKERLSFATFYGAKLDGELGPAPSLITRETPTLFKRISVVDHFKRFFSSELRGISFIDFLRIQNHRN
ncbi:protein SRG1 [Citrus clementina]|uniref:protein SRG1 n=1 Tax=Citrus clementina TaxID=85681 RepID=UPI000CECF7D5|nr:protein SRG1 [Citrus x clementina]